MNNPLTIISGRSQLLASRLTDERDRDAAEAIADQAHRLSNLITALHLFAEQPKPKRQSTDLPLLLEDLLSNLRRQFPDVELSCEVPNYLSDVWVDPAQLSEVLFELLQNALEAGKVTIVTVAVQADPVDGRLIIEVKDNGAGMDEHCLQHAFDPFFSAKPAGRQAGLGLARAQRLIEGHGGTIDLASRPGKGTTATIGLTHWRQGATGHDVPNAA
jgi:signal transduction histidine kinase